MKKLLMIVLVLSLMLAVGCGSREYVTSAQSSVDRITMPFLAQVVAVSVDGVRINTWKQKIDKASEFRTKEIILGVRVEKGQKITVTYK